MFLMFLRFKDLLLGEIVDKEYRLYSVLDGTRNADIGDVYAASNFWICFTDSPTT